VFSGGVVEGQLFIRRSTNNYVQYTSALLCSVGGTSHIIFQKLNISRAYVREI
jgi:ribosomal protein S14